MIDSTTHGIRLPQSDLEDVGNLPSTDIPIRLPAMGKKSWPWKKKSSDKQATEKANASASDSSTIASDIDATQIDKMMSPNTRPRSKRVRPQVVQQPPEILFGSAADGAFDTQSG